MSNEVSFISCLDILVICVSIENCLSDQYNLYGRIYKKSQCSTSADSDLPLHQISYPIYPKYSDTSTPYHICSKIWTRKIHHPMLCLKIAGWVANSVWISAYYSLVSHCSLVSPEKAYPNNEKNCGSAGWSESLSINSLLVLRFCHVLAQTIHMWVPMGTL